MYPINSQVLGTLSDEKFARFCLEQRELRIERTEMGEVIILPPTHSETGFLNSEINRQLANWNHETGLGYVFDSSTGFRLRGKAIRSPDASWLSKVRYQQLSPDDRKGFMKVCPEFVIEFRSESDSLTDMEEKMQHYLSSGAKLAWLIDPKAEKVQVFLPAKRTTILEGFDRTLSGGEVLPGFILDFSVLQM